MIFFLSPADLGNFNIFLNYPSSTNRMKNIFVQENNTIMGFEFT